MVRIESIELSVMFIAGSLVSTGVSVPLGWTKYHIVVGWSTPE